MYISNTPKIFHTKKKINTSLSKNVERSKNKPIKVSDTIYKPKHFPPYITEWVNSIYSYNTNVIKLLPSLDIKVYSLIKSYFYSFILKYNKKIRAKRSRIRTKKSSINTIIASKPSIKHTNNKVSIIVYTYNRNSKYYMAKLKKIHTINRIKKKKFFSLILKKIRNKFFTLNLRLKIIADKFINKATIKHKLLYNYNKTYLKNFIIKNMRREITLISYKQCILFEESKNEKQFLRLLVKLIEKIYKKKVEFDIINLKSVYNSSSIFSKILTTKLKNRKVRPNKLLRLSLRTFKVTAINSMEIYNDRYNRIKFKQDGSIKKLISHDPFIFKSYKGLYDILDDSLYKNSYFYSYIVPTNILGKSELETFKTNLNNIVNSIKNKFTTGIRIEAAGRLTKRNTAQRSVSILKYKGNIRNTDSSIKKLSAVLLRGHARYNLVYTQSKSRFRIGAFGLKTWISG